MTSGSEGDSDFPPRTELVDALGAVRPRRTVTGIDRAPFAYATSFPLHRVTAHLDNGEQLQLIVKDLRWSSLLGDAPSTKPEWLHRPSREIGVYRHLLDPLGIRPSLISAGSGTPPGGEWLALELVAGQPLWEIGDVEIWKNVARWVAWFHDEATSHRSRVARAVPDLVEYAMAWVSHWRERALRSLDDSDDPRATDARETLDALDQMIGPDDLEPVDSTIIHGELYPSNVLVEPSPTGTRTCPIDWELAGIGNRFLDLTALITGWPGDTAERLIDAYLSASGCPHLADDIVARHVAGCRVIHAVRWIGWAPGWRPPEEHAHDWVGELLAQAERLGG